MAKSAGGDASRILPPRFLEKTYQIVNVPANNDIISWNDDGSTFIVWNRTEFATVLLKKHFNHDNFSNFHCRLNDYGFRKVNHDQWEFFNELFRRGQPSLLRDIQPRKARKGARPAVPAVTVAAAPPLPQLARDGSNLIEFTSSGSTSKLIDDNERLGKENSQFNKELSEMRNLCNNINALISNYANKPAETGSQAVKLLDIEEWQPIRNGEESKAVWRSNWCKTDEGRRRGSSGLRSSNAIGLTRGRAID
ncbi:hypothetical protein RHSIM_Rhsim03G0236900 [Rhododendron simsii]|uniref:HSF-type DNA-binding domain-containing protein n=1 Tax=Rhododendron simsii TaxID=118357 RepID=A0A834LU84_RHOSS|nr:hypothetical protein RHSIM_Rhsim03G0236900 [Rhododendron simsii]